MGGYGPVRALCLWQGTLPVQLLVLLSCVHFPTCKEQPWLAGVWSLIFSLK